MSDSTTDTTPEVTALDELTGTPHAEVFETDRPRTVRLQLAADERIPRHRHPESDVVIHLLDGHVELALDDDVYELDPGDVVRFDGTREVSPHATEASTALIVFAPRTE